MTHQDDGLGTLLKSVLNGGKSCFDALRIGDVTVFFVEGNIEINANQDAFAFEI